LLRLLRNKRYARQPLDEPIARPVVLNLKVKPMQSFDDVLAEMMKDPKFRVAYEKERKKTRSLIEKAVKKQERAKQKCNDLGII